jgi:hypothetical protein
MTKGVPKDIYESSVSTMSARPGITKDTVNTLMALGFTAQITSFDAADSRRATTETGSPKRALQFRSIWRCGGRRGGWAEDRDDSEKKVHI